MEWAGKRVLVTGASGFVGSNLVPLLRQTGAEVLAPGRRDYDLLRQEDVARMFAELKPEVVFHLAAYVGGILANRDKPADFCYRNLILGAEVIHQAQRAGVKKYITLMGGAAIRPLRLPQSRRPSFGRGTPSRKAPRIPWPRPWRMSLPKPTGGSTG